MLNVPNADVYTDFDGLAALKRQARENAPAAIKQVAKQFESLFVKMVLKSMRDAKLADGLFENDQSRFYQEMYDQQLAIHLSGETGIGLADVIAKQLGPGTDAAEREAKALDDYLNSPLQAIPPAAGEPTKNVGTALKNGDDLPIQSAKQFVTQLYGYARRAGAELGVEPGVILAQAALETGWGRSIIKQPADGSSFNLFNIKAGSDWQGRKVRVPTLEFEQGIAKRQVAGFRAYDSYQDSFDDYVRLIKNNPRYNLALKHAADPERYLTELQKAGYATDPHYADKIMRLYQGDDIAGFKASMAMAAK